MIGRKRYFSRGLLVSDQLKRKIAWLQFQARCFKPKLTVFYHDRNPVKVIASLRRKIPVFLLFFFFLWLLNHVHVHFQTLWLTSVSD